MEYLLTFSILLILASGFYILLLRKRLKITLIERSNLNQKLFLLSREKIAIESILQSIDDGVIITNNTNNITMLSKKALDILKFDLDSLQGKPVGEILSVDPLGNKILSNEKMGIKLATGETIEAKISSLPVLDSGEIRGVIYTIHDATKEKEFEEMKLDFVTMAVHQLRTPLTTLRGYLSFLSGSISSKLNTEDKQYLDRSITGADQLSALIENLIKITHVEEGEFTIQKKLTHLENLVENVKKNLEELGNQKSVKISFQKPKEIFPEVMIDYFSISHVVNNLIENAIDHSKEGGSVVINIWQKEADLVVDVKDYGEGIPFEATKNLFKKFYQVPDNLRAGSKGMGLGLYISKRIIDAHKGKIWVNTILGRGATFSFSLPIYQPPKN